MLMLTRVFATEDVPTARLDIGYEEKPKSDSISGRNTEDLIGFFDIVNKRYLSIG